MVGSRATLPSRHHMAQCIYNRRGRVLYMAQHEYLKTSGCQNLHYLFISTLVSASRIPASAGRRCVPPSSCEGDGPLMLTGTAGPSTEHRLPTFPTTRSRRPGNVTAKGKQQRRASSGAAETKRALQKSNLISTLTISLQSQLLDTADCGKGLTREHERFEMRTPQAFVAQPPYRTI